MWPWERCEKINPGFSAILNHENRIVVHSDPDQIGKVYDESIDTQLLAPATEGAVYRMVHNGTPMIGFFREVYFYKKRIGKIIIGLDAGELDAQKEV